MHNAMIPARPIFTSFVIYFMFLFISAFLEFSDCFIDIYLLITSKAMINASLNNVAILRLVRNTLL